MPSSGASLNKSPKKNWVENSGGLPPAVRARVRALKRANPAWTLERCIATAWSQYKKEAAAGSAKGTKVTGQLAALQARNKARTRSMSFENPEEWEVVDLGLLRRGKTSAGIDAGFQKSTSSVGSGVKGASFDEGKHVRSQGGRFGNKLNPSELIAARRTVEGGIANLQVGQSFELPGKLGYVKRTPGGYFVQGAPGVTASVRTLSSAVQAAAIIIAGKVRAVN